MEKWLEKLKNLLEDRTWCEVMISKIEDTWNVYKFLLDWYCVREERLISKRFWFIERLVKNNKIRNDGIKPRKDLVKEITIVDCQTNKAIWWANKYTEVEQLLMYLSIQDSPIECLISILKQDD